MTTEVRWLKQEHISSFLYIYLNHIQGLWDIYFFSNNLIHSGVKIGLIHTALHKSYILTDMIYEYITCISGLQSLYIVYKYKWFTKQKFVYDLIYYLIKLWKPQCNGVKEESRLCICLSSVSTFMIYEGTMLGCSMMMIILIIITKAKR